MAKYYFTTDKVSRKFYGINGSNVIIHTVLSDEEIKKELEKVINLPIEGIKEYDGNLEVTLSDNDIVIVSLDAFRGYNDSYENYFLEIKRKIKDYQEYKKIRKLKEKSQGQKVLVNRNRVLPKVLVGTLPLAAALLVLLSANKDSKVEQINYNDKNEDILATAVIDEVNPALLEKIEDSLDIEENKNKDAVMYAGNEATKEEGLNFNTLVEAPKIPEPVEDAKQEKEEVIETSVLFPIEVIDDYERENRIQATDSYCGEIIRYYAKRWGLPAEIIMVQISQERPDIINGVCENVCQLTPPENFVGDYKVPVYDDNGFTGSYDEIHLDRNAVYSLEGNIMAGLIYDRLNVDKQKSIITGLFTYNQGDSMLSNACKYFGLNKDDYLGDDKAAEACELIVSYNDNRGKPKYGDRDYISNVFRYIDFGEDGTYKTTYYIGEEKYEITIANTLIKDYNNTQVR